MIAVICYVAIGAVALVLFGLLMICLLSRLPQESLEEQAECIRKDQEEREKKKREKEEKRRRKRA